jgi:DNA-binding NarL/FixJ family response regulator
VIRIALVDDHKIVRDGIKAMLIAYDDISVIGETTDAETMLTCIKGLNPDVLLLDIVLPAMDGITLAEILNKRMPGIKILILSSSIDELSIVRAAQAGINGYLSKDSSAEELVKAIRLIYNGEEYFGEKISGIIFRSYQSKTGNKQGIISTHDLLTEREKDVVKCFGDGLSYKETAAKLFLSPRTVETHRNTIMEKLDLHSLAELIKYAIRNGIVKL